MKKTLALSPVRFNGSWLRVALITLSTLVAASVCLINADTLGSAATVAWMKVSDPLKDIGFTGSFTDEDAAYLRDGLQFLRGYAPEWYAYIAQAKPLMLSIDLAEGERGLAAVSNCCDARGYGLITFGAHLEDLPDDLEDPTVQARQIEFLGTLIHEITHVRDRRAGRIPATVDFAACIKGERSAFTAEVEFKRALLSAEPNIPVLTEVDRVSVERQIEPKASALKGNGVHLICLSWVLSGSE